MWNRRRCGLKPSGATAYLHSRQIKTLHSTQYTERSIARNKRLTNEAVRLRHPETRRRRERHHAAAVSRVGTRYLPRSSKRLTFHPAKFEPASTPACSDWQKRNTEQYAIAHSSENNRVGSIKRKCVLFISTVEDRGESEAPGVSYSLDRRCGSVPISASCSWGVLSELGESSGHRPQPRDRY